MTRLNGEDAEFRYESDSVGTKAIPKNAYYGVHSVRAVENRLLCRDLRRAEELCRLSLEDCK